MKTVRASGVGQVMFILILLGAVAGPSSDAAAQTLTTLYTFPTAAGDGAAPFGGLIADAAGNLYGTTKDGGPIYGTVFTLMPNPDGTYSESVLHRFDGGSDGQTPYAGLIADAVGNLYGTTYACGIDSSACGGWCGTVFMLNPTGTLTVLHSFNFSDGAKPSRV